MERLEASDRIIDTLLKYQYINGSSEADYALQSLQSWRAELKESLGRKGREAPGQGGVGGARRAKPKKKKIKAKQMFAKMGMNQRTEEVEGQGERHMHSRSIVVLLRAFVWQMTVMTVSLWHRWRALWTVRHAASWLNWARL